eukprot:TRINITY_DN91_c0_g2_i1.p1 TRINITY_DN91_c0_g2~~TRINITY_DN91_c0_g2_i1.p1  ORF type:complete len:312 (+),score=107.55 TRINITY_DN91_c0_g2_i1:88-936(+)
MASGTVRAWNGRHGFVKLDDGRICYVHDTDIKLGGALRLGSTVTVGHVEEVEGHKGRVKGSMVSGPGVLSKEEYEAGLKVYRASDEYKQKKAEAKQKKKDKSARRAQNALQQAMGGKKKRGATEAAVGGLSVDAKKRLIAQLQRDVQGGADRRRDPTDPASTATYTKQDFIAFHGQQEGARLWNIAGLAVPPPPQQQPAAGTGKKKNKKKKKKAAGGGGDGPPVVVASAERRRDPTDPASTTTYTLQDFIDFHGQGKAQQLWAQAAPKPAGRGAGSRGRGQS